MPTVQTDTVAQGYAILHRAGLRVTIAQPFQQNTLANPAEYIVQTSPRAGRLVRAGATVSLRIGCPVCALGSPGVPTAIPSYRVPAFVGKHLSTVSAWLQHKVLYLTENIGPLRKGDAATFYANYTTIRQSPAAGSVIRLGHGHRTGPTSGSFTPTPLVIWLAQKRSAHWPLRTIGPHRKPSYPRASE